MRSLRDNEMSLHMTDGIVLPIFQVTAALVSRIGGFVPNDTMKLCYRNYDHKGGLSNIAQLH